MRFFLTACFLLLSLSLLGACGGGKSHSGQKPPTVTGLAITPAAASITAGLTGQLAVRATWSDDTTTSLDTGVTWSASAPDIASIDANGLVTAKRVGASVVTATANGLSTHTVVTVAHDPASPQTALEVTPATPSIRRGDTQQFIAAALYADGAAIDHTADANWASSDNTIATVTTSGDTRGIATGTGIGNATVTATLGDFTASTVLTVTPPTLVELQIAPHTAGIRTGTTLTFSIVAVYSDASTSTPASGVTWSSSNPDIATIDANGVATGVAMGSTTITGNYGGSSHSADLAVGIGIREAGRFTTGLLPFDVAAMDVNGDGNQDLVVAEFGSGNLAMFTGDGTGAMTAGMSIATGSANYRLTTADINLDGHTDLLYAGYGSGNVNVLPGTGTGFGTAVPFPGGASILWLQPADLNADGKPDVVLTNSDSATITAMMGDGTGTLTALAPRSLDANPFAIAVADFNQDGNQDLVVSNTADETVSVLPGIGDGTFGVALTLTAGTTPSGVVIGDFNEDGHADFAVGTKTALVLFAGQGDGTFAAPVSITLDAQPEGLAVTDLNGDGHQDLVVTSSSSSTVTLLLGTGLATFSPAMTLGTDQYPGNPVIADFNGDGRPDIAFVCEGANEVTVLLTL